MQCPVEHPSGNGCPVEKGCPVTQGDVKPLSNGCPIEKSISQCPVDGSTTGQVPSFNVAANDLVFDHSRQVDQKHMLSVKRSVSSIPKSDFTPSHQPSNLENWVYPSEQQYYNAMKRKGYSPDERDVPAILFIHNVVNEQGWSKVKEWETYRGNSNPKLKRFMGKPTQLSPKAYLLNLIGYAKPFDRHDWIIERNGKDVRYVIDFYSGAKDYKNKQGPISIYLDVRPALDSVDAIIDRISLAFRQKFLPFSLPKKSLTSTPFFESLSNSKNKYMNIDPNEKK